MPNRVNGAELSHSHPGFFLPTGRLKPPASGSDKPNRFDQLSEKNQSNSNSKAPVQSVSTG